MYDPENDCGYLQAWLETGEGTLSVECGRDADELDALAAPLQALSAYIWGVHPADLERREGRAGSGFYLLSGLPERDWPCVVVYVAQTLPSGMPLPSTRLDLIVSPYRAYDPTAGNFFSDEWDESDEARSRLVRRSGYLGPPLRELVAALARRPVRSVELGSPVWRDEAAAVLLQVRDLFERVAGVDRV